MKVERLVEIISANYHFQVKQYAKLNEHSYRLETNFGPKRLTSWNNYVLLEWAFRWRERMADMDYRQIDRFIRTSSGNAYVQEERIYLAVQDLYEGEALTLTSAEQYKHMGQFVGAWCQACTAAAQELPQQLKQKQYGAVWSKEMKETEGHGERLQAFKRRMATLNDSMFTYLIRQHWPSIKKRFRQAIFLERASQFTEREGIFPLVISLEQWRCIKEGYVVFQAIDQQISPDFRSVANLLQSMYTDQQVSLTDIEQFYLGFSEAYQADVNTHYHLLSQLIYPRQFLDILSAYFNKERDEEESIQAWLKACQEQDRLDELHLWLANIIDQGKQEQGLG